MNVPALIFTIFLVVALVAVNVRPRDHNWAASVSVRLLFLLIIAFMVTTWGLLPSDGLDY